MSVLIDGGRLLAVAVLAVAELSTISYLRSSQEDPGLTSEAALVLTVLLGGLAVHYPGFAAGAADAVAVLLASRNQIHRFVGHVLSEEELHDALVFAVGIFVILPLVPDRYVGPLHAINLHTIWIIVVACSQDNAPFFELRRVPEGIGSVPTHLRKHGRAEHKLDTDHAVLILPDLGGKLSCP